MKRGDLIRIVKRIPLPQFLDKDVGKFGIVTGDAVWGPRGMEEWVVVLVDGQFQLHAKQNLEVINEDR